MTSAESTRDTRRLIDHVTPLILTYNEGPNIGRCLAMLGWAREVVVIDSVSTDDTAAIVSRAPRSRLIARPFDDHASQWNFGHAQVASDWVLALDCDYILTDEVVRELESLTTDTADGYEANFIYCVYGRPLRGTLYPARPVLYRRDRAHYRNEGHTQRLILDGQLATLRARIHHDDRKPLSRWLQSQQRYARLEAEHLLGQSPEKLRRIDRLRRLGWPAPALAFLYVLFIKGCILDGWPGWFYALQRLLAETMIALEIVDRRIGSGR